MPKHSKQDAFKTMTYAEMQSLVKKGFSFEDLTSHPSLIYRRTMMKRRGQLLRMMAILEGSSGTNTGRFIATTPQLPQLKVTHD